MTKSILVQAIFLALLFMIPSNLGALSAKYDKVNHHLFAAACFIATLAIIAAGVFLNKVQFKLSILFWSAAVGGCDLLLFYYYRKFYQRKRSED
ncbi:hypothetical protein [Cupriavidus necator]